MREMANLGIEQIFTSYDNPKGNADTERMIRTIKEEVIWLHEFTSLTEAREIIGSWIEKYNREYVHSALGYLSPLEFEQKFYQNYCQEAA
ncbi:MAG: integrase core domain-containing protein [Candidatus Desulfofervidaceae bacterium]|nr:integrase core domain-containing protein [Candidatus Desulfofervidaceae bacterium]